LKLQTTLKATPEEAATAFETTNHPEGDTGKNQNIE
jgi:hypothetical protein